MPNWCDNIVNISGDAEDIKTFKDKAFSKGVFHFNNLIPMPKELDISSGYFGKGTPEQKELEKLQSSNIVKYGYKDWFDWACDNWGTKWDINAQDTSDDNEFIDLEFETAWGPPECVFYYIKDNFPRLDISWFYHEPGMEMAGYLEG